MPKGYWVAHVNIADPEGYKKYVAAATPAFEKYGAKFLARGGRYSGVEGTARERNVIIEFDSYEQALACYNSPEYSVAAKLRQAAGTADLIVVEGVG
jgi:uncharacterized protein (DUF1330 family)